MRRDRFLDECRRRFGFGKDANLRDILSWMIWADTFIDESREFVDDNIIDIITEKANVTSGVFRDGMK